MQAQHSLRTEKQHLCRVPQGQHGINRRLQPTGVSSVSASASVPHLRRLQPTVNKISSLAGLEP
jgi:hypothetical protein